MKYSITRRINLSNIDRKLWSFEHEDLGVKDADSFEEAQKEVDKQVVERIAYYKKVAEAENELLAKESPKPEPPTPGEIPPTQIVIPEAPAPAPAPATVTPAPTPGSPPPAPTPGSPPPTTTLAPMPAAGDVSNQPPQEFN